MSNPQEPPPMSNRLLWQTSDDTLELRAHTLGDETWLTFRLLPPAEGRYVEVAVPTGEIKGLIAALRQHGGLHA